MTQEQFVKILPAYMGCMVTGRKLTGKLLGIDRHGFCYTTTLVGDIHFTHVKLILRTFDQMTDEEKVKMQNFISVFNSLDEINHHKYRVQVYSGLVNYLRSIGIDCDGLIEAGYAIKEDTE